MRDCPGQEGRFENVTRRNICECVKESESFLPERHRHHHYNILHTDLLRVKIVIQYDRARILSRSIANPCYSSVMINNNSMKLRPFVFTVLMIAVIISLMGCMSVNTSSIAAHDSLRFPTVGLRSDETVSEGGLVVKTTPTWSDSDSAYTHSIQGGYVHSVVIPLLPNAKLSFAGGASGYYAWNTLTGVFEGTESETKTLTGYGFTGQFKPSLFLGSGDGRFMIGGNFVYNKEYGDYLDFRHTFDALNEKYPNNVTRLDLSPHGQTFMMMVHPGYAYVLDKDSVILMDFGIGYQYTDFIWNNSYRWLVYSATISYTGKHYWMWAGWEWFTFLNSGISLGVGLRLR